MTREDSNTAGDTSSALDSAWTRFKLKSSALLEIFIYLVCLQTAIASPLVPVLLD